VSLQQLLKTCQRLIDVSSNMRENRRYMRVYWSGVALALKADWILRINNNGSLDSVLKQFQECCLHPNRTWTAGEFINKLDELSGSNIFTELYNEYAFSDKFPDLDDVYDSLGLINNKDKLILSRNTEAINLRKAIMENSVNN